MAGTPDDLLCRLVTLLDAGAVEEAYRLVLHHTRQLPDSYNRASLWASFALLVAATCDTSIDNDVSSREVKGVDVSDLEENANSYFVPYSIPLDDKSQEDRALTREQLDEVARRYARDAIKQALGEQSCSMDIRNDLAYYYMDYDRDPECAITILEQASNKSAAYEQTDISRRWIMHCRAALIGTAECLRGHLDLGASLLIRAYDNSIWNVEHAYLSPLLVCRDHGVVLSARKAKDLCDNLAHFPSSRNSDYDIMATYEDVNVWLRECTDK
jgi:hypothetical protein